MCLNSAGTSQDILGILGYLVFRDLWASTVLGIPRISLESRDVLGCPGNPRILSIKGYMCLHSAGTSCKVPGIPGYLVFRDLWTFTVLSLPRMSRHHVLLPGSIVLGVLGKPQESLDT